MMVKVASADGMGWEISFDEVDEGEGEGEEHAESGPGGVEEKL